MNTIEKKCLLLLFLAAWFVEVQAQSFAKNDVDLLICVGLTNQLILPGQSLKTPPLLFSVEKGMAENLSAGVTLGYALSQSSRYELLSDAYRVRYNYFWIAARVVYYFQLSPNEKLRTSAGLTIGWGCGFARFDGEGDLESVTMNYPPVIGQVIGVFGNVRYRLHSRIWIFGEFGWGSTPLAAGLNIPLSDNPRKKHYSY